MRAADKNGRLELVRVHTCATQLLQRVAEIPAVVARRVDRAGIAAGATACRGGCRRSPLSACKWEWSRDKVNSEEALSDAARLHEKCRMSHQTRNKAWQRT